MIKSGFREEKVGLERLIWWSSGEQTIEERDQRQKDWLGGMCKEPRKKVISSGDGKKVWIEIGQNFIILLEGGLGDR